RGTVPFCSEDSAKLGQSPAVQNGWEEGGQSHFAPKTPQNWDSPRPFRTAGKKGDSPILLRRLRKIGTVPGRSEIVSKFKFRTLSARFASASADSFSLSGRS